MEKMIAYCGLACYQCPALIATTMDDDQKREETTRLWAKQFNLDLKPSDINCHGCLSEDGVLFSHCKVCEIRACGKGKGVLNCADCSEYACTKLENFFHLAPHAQKHLEKIRSRR